MLGNEASLLANDLLVLAASFTLQSGRFHQETAAVTRHENPSSDKNRQH